MTKRAFCSWVVALALFAPAALAETILVLASAPGDYIGGGRFRIITPAQYDFHVFRTFDNGVRFEINDYFRPNPTFSFWWVTFAAPFDAQLAVGSYEGAIRWPTQPVDKPGIDISGDGRGCTGYGRFDIREVQYNQSGVVVRFAADFEQHCDYPTAPVLLGAIRYNSDLPISLQAPPGIGIDSPLNGEGCVEAAGPQGATVPLTALQEQAGSYGFAWTSDTGLSGTGEHFQVPVALDSAVLVTLTQTNLSTSETISVSRSICVSDTAPPLVAIIRPRWGEVLTTTNIPLEVQVIDAVDKAIPNYKATVGYEATIPLRNGRSRTSLARVKTVPGGTEVSVYVEATDSHGNTNWAQVAVIIAPGPKKK